MNVHARKTVVSRVDAKLLAVTDLLLCTPEPICIYELLVVGRCCRLVDGVIAQPLAYGLLLSLQLDPNNANLITERDLTRHMMLRYQLAPGVDIFSSSLVESLLIQLYSTRVKKLKALNKA